MELNVKDITLDELYALKDKTFIPRDNIIYYEDATKGTFEIYILNKDKTKAKTLEDYINKNDKSWLIGHSDKADYEIYGDDNERYLCNYAICASFRCLKYHLTEENLWLMSVEDLQKYKEKRITEMEESIKWTVFMKKKYKERCEELLDF